MTDAKGFRLTYSTMFDPPASLHERFEAALEAARAMVGAEHSMHIGAQPVAADTCFELRSPIDSEWLLGRFQSGDASHVERAVGAARGAFATWLRTPWQ